ncbi:MAG: hemerythrin domain-containing protein [Nanoarchaeota archaeon]
METTRILADEHRYILKVAGALRKETEALAEGKPLDTAFFTTAVDFIRNYADKFHHAKEEDILFVEFCNNLENAHCNPVEQMLHEHETGREYVRGLEDAIKRKNVPDVIENARGYASLIEEHIYKEDNILYPMADQAIPAGMHEAMLGKFKRAEKMRFDRQIKDRYMALASELEDNASRAAGYRRWGVMPLLQAYYKHKEGRK